MASSRKPSRRKPSPERPGGPASSADRELLTELALDLRWSWNHRADQLWAQLEPELWARTHNPWVVLQTVSRTRLENFLVQPEHREQIEALLDDRRQHLASTAWFQRSYPRSALTRVAYFSMEFGAQRGAAHLLRRARQRGRGPAQGRQRSWRAGDRHRPPVPAGLLPTGHSRRRWSAGSVPLQRSRAAPDHAGTRCRRRVAPSRIAAGRRQGLAPRVAGYRSGDERLYLLDSNDPANPPASRAITSELYGDGAELRFQQELVLGIGGWRLLRALGLEPDVCHLNEGHAALAVLERARSFMKDHGRPFDVALAVTRAGQSLYHAHACRVRLLRPWPHRAVPAAIRGERPGDQR